VKVARTVLRGAGRSDASRLPDKELGAQVRKGEKSTIAIFYKSYTKEVEAPDTGEKTDESRRVLKAYPVFNGAP